MDPLKILQLILALAPSGIQLTSEIVKIVQAISDAINAAPNTPPHQSAVAVLQSQIGPK